MVNTYLYSKDDNSVIKLNSVPKDQSNGLLLFQTASPSTGLKHVRMRKGEKNEKDLFIEVWNEEDGFLTSRKVSDKVTKIYNDTIFGTASWSRDESKIIFIGEKPEPASYKAYWEDEQAKKEEESG